MSKRIKIGISNADTEAKFINYANWLKQDDDTIEIVKLSSKENNLDKVTQIDALVLSGGIDTHPKYYGSNTLDYPHAPETFDEIRDAFESKLFALAIQCHIPILGVCRGMQLINCILGGDLIQDNGISANDTHKNDKIDKLHAIQIFHGTLLNEISKVESGKVNSAHHQSIKHLGNGLQINAKAADGIIEGIEWKDKTGKPFFLAVQWHPERMEQQSLGDSPLSKNIREYLISELTRNKK